MLTVLLLISTLVCAVGWFGSRLSTMTLLHFMSEKGYTLPTPAEVKACSQKATKQMFRRWAIWKGTR